jgi:hypothetical protein
MEQAVIVDLAAPRLDRQPAPVQDEDTVREAHDLRQLRGAEEDRPAAVGEIADESIDLPFGPDVDAARRVVEQEDGR